MLATGISIKARKKSDVKLEKKAKQDSRKGPGIN